jgi:hypothetical protein
MKVWKFPFTVKDNVQITMPIGAKILHVDEQGDPMQLNFWALCDPHAQNETRFFQVRGTDHDCGTLIELDGVYIGTVSTKPMPLVWHVWEVKP